MTDEALNLRDMPERVSEPLVEAYQRYVAMEAAMAIVEKDGPEATWEANVAMQRFADNTRVDTGILFSAIIFLKNETDRFKLALLNEARRAREIGDRGRVERILRVLGMAEMPPLRLEEMSGVRDGSDQ